MREEVIKNVYEKRIIAIVRGLSAEESFQTAKALCEGGINMIEVTFNQAADDGFCSTTAAIRRINEELGGQVMAGAGTVMTVEQVKLAWEAGAKYIITPNTDEEIIRCASRLGLVTMPGAFTPTEIERAYEAGADFVKVFPVGQLGPDYIRAVRGPLSHIPLMAVGGIDETKLQVFLRAGAVGFGIGGNLVNRQWIKQGQFEKITELARLYVKNLQQEA